MNLGGTIARFARDFTRKRAAAPTWANGFATPGAVTTATIRALVHPATGGDLERLPQGDRSSNDVFRVFTTDDLRGIDVAAGTPADALVIGGVDHEVIAIDEWETGAYKDALVRRRGQ